MIVSASRRTDIPNYYSEWFVNRIQKGFVYVRNPMNPHQVSRIDLSPDAVDCIVFWTKNPSGMMKHLGSLKDYAYYFQFTLTGYGKDVEPNLPDKRKDLIPVFRRLSEHIGKERVVWRYDPIFLNERYTMEYHLKAFETIAESLTGYTEKVVISFLDLYRKIQHNAAKFHMREMTDAGMTEIAGEMVRIASNLGLIVETCAEKIDLQSLGIHHGSCIDKSLIERITGCRLTGEKDRNQRRECGCLESMDVGTYHTCLNGCKYCYANFSDEKVKKQVKRYRADAELLCGEICPDDKITIRKGKQLRDFQIRLFEQ